MPKSSPLKRLALAGLLLPLAGALTFAQAPISAAGQAMPGAAALAPAPSRPPLVPTPVVAGDEPVGTGKWPTRAGVKLLRSVVKEERPGLFIPDCGPKEMLTEAKTQCVPDPAFIPVEVPPETVRLANANIKTSMPAAQFQADYNRILAARPDFITLQEVPRRPDAVLAVNGYEIYRSHHSPFTAETPVLWDSTRWEALSTGTRYLTVKKVKWGVRAVNWATLRSLTTGRVVTIMSAHPAPTIKRTEGLLPVFIARLKPLVETLYAEGDVLVAGDFNVHYRGGLWAKSGLANSTLVPTFDQFGKVATGRKFGATIDYMFARQSETLTPTAQGRWLQNSDHNALWSEWVLSTPREALPAEVKAAVLKPAEGVLPPG